jgi:hypothetical protein
MYSFYDLIKNGTLNQEYWYMPVIPATQEVKAERSLEPRNKASLGNTARPVSTKKTFCFCVFSP